MKAEYNEKVLLEGLVLNDRKAIETIYRQHFNMVQALVVNNSGNVDDARDIFQESLIVLYEKVSSGSFELNCLLKTYIYSVSRRLWLKRLAQQSRYTLSGDHEEHVPVEDDTEEHERRDQEFQMMEKAFSAMGEPCKSLLEAYYMQKRSMQDIASHFGYTNADNAKNQKYKCLVRLKKIFFTQYKTESI